MYSRGALKTMLLIVVAVMLIGAFAFLAWPRPRLARAQTRTPTPASVTSDIPRTVSVAGHGEVQAPPDQAVVIIGVESQAATAEAALDDNSSKMAALLSVIRGAGIASKDIQTTNFSIFPVYEERTNRSTEPPAVVGYRVSNQVVVKVRPIDTLGTLLDAVVRAGANQIHGISFGFSDPQALLDQARERAMNDAQRKATQLATLGESELGLVLTISEGGVTPPPVIMQRGFALEEAAAAVPIEAGEATVAVDVQVTYALR